MGLVKELLAEPSGGLFPLFFSVSILQAFKDCHNLPWKIEWQGINVADAPSGAGGDITLRTTEGEEILTIEITERKIDKNRVVSTFNSKILIHKIKDYLFLFSAVIPEKEAFDTAKGYFPQGYEINFISIEKWIESLLVTMSATCRKLFTASCVSLMKGPEVSAVLKPAWNEKVRVIIMPND